MHVQPMFSELTKGTQVLCDNQVKGSNSSVSSVDHLYVPL